MSLQKTHLNSPLRVPRTFYPVLGRWLQILRVYMHVRLHDVTGDNNWRERESPRSLQHHPCLLIVRAVHHRTPISTTLLITRTAAADRTTPGEGIAWNGRRSGWKEFRRFEMTTTTSTMREVVCFDKCVGFVGALA